jgi:hypothetical protein
MRRGRIVWVGLGATLLFGLAWRVWHVQRAGGILGRSARLNHTRELLKGALSTIERGPNAEEPELKDLAARIRSAKEKADEIVGRDAAP